MNVNVLIDFSKFTGISLIPNGERSGKNEKNGHECTNL
jgi:hypothetical protein